MVSYAINLLLTGTTERGDDPSDDAARSAADARNTYHFLASGQQALPMDSQGNFWTGANVFSSGNLKLDLLHNFFLECGARAGKIRVYETVDDPTARACVGFLLVRGGVHNLILGDTDGADSTLAFHSPTRCECLPRRDRMPRGQ